MHKLYICPWFRIYLISIKKILLQIFTILIIYQRFGNSFNVNIWWTICFECNFKLISQKTNRWWSLTTLMFANIYCWDFNLGLTTNQTLHSHQRFKTVKFYTNCQLSFFWFFLFVDTNLLLLSFLPFRKWKKFASP